ncbi:MAG: hypothetical protein J7M19_03260 [Planctomycetes bacterium]|nr:hypothetical protein [Planctomycetota bacterium]
MRKYGKSIVILACAWLLLSGLPAAWVWAGESLEAIEKWDKEAREAVSEENIAAFAEGEENLDVLAGLAMLSYGRIGTHILDRAVKAEPNKAPIFYAAVHPRWRRDAAAYEDPIRADPFNALPYYRKAAALWNAGRRDEALAAFRQGASCPVIKTYHKEIAENSLKALDALGLEGPARLAALLQLKRRFVEVRWLPYGLGNMMNAAPRTMETEDKKVFAENLLTLAGQLFANADACRDTKQTARWALARAFSIKNRVRSAQESPQAAAYAEASRLVDKQLPHTATDSDDAKKFIEGVFAGLYRVPPLIRDITQTLALEPDFDDEVRLQLESLQKELAQKAERFINLVAADADATVGLWITGCPEDAESTIEDQYPGLVRLAEEFLDFLHSAQETNLEHSPIQKTKNRLKVVGLGMLMYSNDHEARFPPTLDTLHERKYVYDENCFLSHITGERFVYLGDGLRDDDRPIYISVYDAKPLPDGTMMALFVDGHVEAIPAEQLEETLQKQEKRKKR